MQYRLLLFILIFFTPVAKAQFTYSFSQRTETYVPLSSATSVNNGQLWNVEDFQIPIGFKFTMGHAQIDSVYVQGPTFISTNNNDSEFSGFWTLDADLCDRGIHDSSAPVSPILYKVEGNNGSRICKIEFRNAGLRKRCFPTS